MAIQKIKILRAFLELPAKQHCQSSPFPSKLGQIGQIGSAVQLVAPKSRPAKKAPRILIFSIVLGAEYLFYLKSIATYAPEFLGHNNSFLARVYNFGNLGQMAKKVSDISLMKLVHRKLMMWLVHKRQKPDINNSYFEE